MASLAGHGAGIDLANPDVFAGGRGHDAWRHLRNHAPIAWNPGRDGFPGFWSITRYEDIRRISRDPDTFVSSRGYLMVTDPKRPGPSAGLGKVLLGMDAPRHTSLRRIVNAAFTPRAVARFEPQIRAAVVDIVATIPRREACDFVATVARPLSLATICTLLGVPREDWQRLSTLCDRILGATAPEARLLARVPIKTLARGLRAIVGRSATRQFLDYFRRLVARRRSEPRDDLLDLLIGSEVDGAPLTDDEIAYFCYLLFLAGTETTRNAIAGGMLAFLEHPAEWARLRADPGLLPSAVEEILRWTSPIMHMARIAARDVEVSGQLVLKGEKVVLWYPSANRDADAFPAPDRFDIGRPPATHLAFGVGPHFCLGAGLARLQLGVLFETLAGQRPEIALAGDVERLPSVFIGGLRRLPMRLDPAA